MSEQRITGIQRRRPSALILFAIAVSTIILASCGGGGSDTTSSAQSADGTKQALAVSGTTATVPGGWTGRAPKMEVINGITVPPEPAPAINNATLAGVDVNANGVRDDVERKLAGLSNAQVSYDKTIFIARAYQSIISFSGVRTRANSIEFERRLTCSINMAGNTPKQLNSPYGNQSITELSANTAARKQALAAHFGALGNVIDSEDVACNQ
jgi:hypothetical protein